MQANLDRRLTHRMTHCQQMESKFTYLEFPYGALPRPRRWLDPRHQLALLLTVVVKRVEAPRTG